MDTLLKDPGLAPAGLRKIDFAASRMPVLSAVADELARTRPLAGHRIAACLHVTTETANLCRALPAGRRRPGQRADPGRGRRRRPQATIHISRRDPLGGIVGGTEVTSTGVLRARNMAREGALAYPLLAVNDAATKHLFDNRYGTGQSTLDGILRATNVLLAGKVLVVVGYGWCGRGLASRARGRGAGWW